MEWSEQMQGLIDGYIQWQTASPSPFHVVESLKASFQAHHFTLLDPLLPWQIVPGGRYIVLHPEGKSMIAFIAGRKNPRERGFAMGCAHTDSPVLRLRLRPWSCDEGYSRLATEIHGGIIARSWLDRPLSVAGAVYSLEKSPKGEIVFDQATALPRVKRQLVAAKRPLMIIPDIAIHLDREKNNNGAIDLENTLTAICGLNGSLEVFKQEFWQALGLNAEQADGFELCLSPVATPILVGLQKEFITGPRHDDLAMVYAISQGLLAVARDWIPEKTAVAGFFDGEETGSQSASGAESSFFKESLLKVIASYPESTPLGGHDNPWGQSFLISGDMAHGFNPAYAHKHDRNHRAIVNAGIVLKENANDRYATSGESAALFKGLCAAAAVPLQMYVNRQDIGCGSTIGPILAASLNCLAVDMGTAMWAMHSTAETMGTKDLYYAQKLFHTFFRGPEFCSS